VSFDATRAAWAARRAGALCGGTRLLVALAMADQTFGDTGELVAGTRGLAALCGVSQDIVVETQRELQAAGVIERAERGLGSRPSRWRWTLAAPSTGSAQAVDNFGQRSTSRAVAQEEKSANGLQRSTSRAVALDEKSEYQDQVYPRVNSNSDAVIVAELLDESGAPPRPAPDEVAATVAAIRETLNGRRGVASAAAPPSSEPPPAPTDLDAVGPHVDEPWGGHLGGYVEPDDGWTP
jgi:hypothetical protein